MAKTRKKKKEKKVAYQKKAKIIVMPQLQRRNSKIFVGVAVVALLLCIFLLLMNWCKVKTITVEGNVHYSNDEIVAMVMKNKLDHNSLYLSMKYRKKGIMGIPFIEKMSVDILAPDSIKITVYEKAVAGYIEYLGKYMYFDKDGIIVETSDVKTAGIPQITGLQFDYVVLHESLPIEDETIFQSILDITQLLTKYEISVDKIYFDNNNQMTLYFENIRVRLGDISNIDDKIIQLKAILPELKGQKGILRMENYVEGMKNITFNKDS
ncbi:MAG: FtsQ-type POTRA domain-containing protein [Lachnospiraceae bacterium]|nr:FtsQ-type POTRA domain-containing protein [Lachnospiraceae bacterium]